MTVFPCIAACTHSSELHLNGTTWTPGDDSCTSCSCLVSVDSILLTSHGPSFGRLCVFFSNGSCLKAVVTWLRVWCLCRVVTTDKHFYRPQRSCGQGNIFTPVCHSVRRGGVLPQCMLGYHTPPGQGRTPPDQTPPWIRHPPQIRHHHHHPPPPPPIRHHPPWSDPPPREADSSIRSTSGRYASYWNAFLLKYMFLYW